MSSNLPRSGSASLSSIVGKGTLVGIAGGLAEIAVVSLYGALADVSVTDVGRRIASAVNLNWTDAWTGLAIHMALAVVLGVALTVACNMRVRRHAGALSPYAFATLTLATVWGVNFFVVLPVVSPGFVTLLPYWVTLLSKLMFGLAAAISLQTLRDMGSVVAFSSKVASKAVSNKRVLSRI